jgi:hypothetical protein
MAFSPVHQIEIDSTFRLASSTSSTSFEYELPFSWPVFEPSQLRLVGFCIPNTFFNFPTQTITVNGVTSGLNLNTGNYTAVQAAAAVTTLVQLAAPDGCGRASLSCVYDSSLKRFYFIDTVGGGYQIQSVWLPLLGFSATSYTMLAPANARNYGSFIPSLGYDETSRLYVRIQSFENKIILPNAYNTFVSYALPLDTYDSDRDMFYLGAYNYSQKIIVASSFMKTNRIIKVDLLRRDGSIVNLNGRNWLMVLRVEPLNYEDN